MLVRSLPSPPPTSHRTPHTSTCTDARPGGTRDAAIADGAVRWRRVSQALRPLRVTWGACGHRTFHAQAAAQTIDAGIRMSGGCFLRLPGDPDGPARPTSVSRPPPAPTPQPTRSCPTCIPLPETWLHTRQENRNPDGHQRARPCKRKTPTCSESDE